MSEPSSSNFPDDTDGASSGFPGDTGVMVPPFPPELDLGQDAGTTSVTLSSFDIVVICSSSFTKIIVR